MELSPHNPTHSHSKPKNNVIETPRTSNLNFLRAKRLNYFCGKSSRNPLLKKEISQDAGQTFRTETPHRRLSAPSSSHVIAYSDVPQKMSDEFKAMSLNGETSLQTTEETKPPVPTFPQGVHANPGKELTNIPAHHTQPLPTSEMEGKERTKYRNTPNKSIANSLQPTISNPPVPSVHLNLKPVTAKHKKDIPIQQGPQAMLEKADGKVSCINPIFQSSHKEEVEVKGFPLCHGSMSTHYQVKNDKQIPQSQMKPDLDEFEVLSSHRSLLRSSFVTDLDQNLLDDLSVPESEKLHHVMTWAKKFLDKCNRGELASATGDALMKNMTEDSSLDSIVSARITDNHLRLDDYDSEKLPCLGDEVSVSLKSPKCVAKRELKSKETQLDSFLAGPMSNLLQTDHEKYEDNFFEPLLVGKSDERDNLNIMGFADSEKEFIGNIKQSTIDSDDLFGSRPKPNRQHYNTHIFRDIKSDVTLKDNHINRDYDSSSPDSCLNTGKLTFTLEDLELKEKGLKNTGDKDGGRTDRTFLVKKSEKSDDNTYICVSGKITDRRQPAVHKVHSNMDLSDGYTRKIYQKCPTCSFTNTTSSNWCSECGLALNRAEVKPTRNSELPNPYISDDKDVDDFFSINNQKRSFDPSMSKELGSAVCWEDNSDVVSDSEGSVLDKYFFCVKQLDILRSQEKEQQTKFYQYEHASETSSDDESSQDYFMLRASGQAKPGVEVKTLAPEIHHVGDEAMNDRPLVGSNEHIIGTEGSNVKGLLGKEFDDNDNF